MGKVKSDLYKLIVCNNGEKRCKLCGAKLSKNITRVKIHFMKNCPSAFAIRVRPKELPLVVEDNKPSIPSATISKPPEEVEESIGIDTELEDIIKNNVQINCSAVIPTSTPSAITYDQVFQYEPNVSQYSGTSGYQNSPSMVNSGRIQSAPTNGSSQHSQRLLPKGGKNRNANILSAVLCLIKELDYASLEVVDTTIHCRMEEMED